jgi:hypothetical protein
MDALTWFKSVFHRGRPTDDLSRADAATESWADVPLHLVAARLRPPPVPAGNDEEWDAVIARAKMQAASPNARRLPPPPARDEWAEMSATPPPSPGRQARIRTPAATKATLDALVWGGQRKSAAVTPLPLAELPRAVARLYGPAKG